MRAAPTRRWPGIAGAFAGLWLAGCASIGAPGAPGAPDAPPKGPGSARTAAGQMLAPQAAMERVAIGQSRKAEVDAALGKAIVIPFDSGYEVWVYRWRGADRTPGAATELVLLFDPSGLLTRLRLRPGAAPRP